MVVFLWMRWRDVGCSSLHERHISFDFSYGGTNYCRAVVLERVLHLFSVSLFLEQPYTLSDGKHLFDIKIII